MSTIDGDTESISTARAARSAAAAAWRFLNGKGKSKTTTRQLAADIPSSRKKRAKGKANAKATNSQSSTEKAPQTAESTITPVTHALGNVFAPRPTCNEQTDSAFMNLPPEIRIRIYQEYFDNTMLFLVARNKQDANSMMREIRLEARTEQVKARMNRIFLLLICRRMYLEAVEVLFSKAVFNLNEPGVIQRLPAILPSRIDRGFNGIRTISTICQVDPEGMKNFAGACKLFASIPCLRSLSIDVTPSTCEYNRRLQDLETCRKAGGSIIHYREDSLIIELESTIRCYVRQISQAKSVCIWFQWPRYSQSFEPLPPGCRIHRRYRTFGVFQSVEEDHDANLIGCSQLCSRCTFG